MPASYSILAFGSTLKAEQHAHFIIHTQGFQRVQVQEIPFTQKITVSDGFWRFGPLVCKRLVIVKLRQH